MSQPLLILIVFSSRQATTITIPFPWASNHDPISLQASFTIALLSCKLLIVLLLPSSPTITILPHMFVWDSLCRSLTPLCKPSSPASTTQHPLPNGFLISIFCCSGGGEQDQLPKLHVSEIRIADFFSFGSAMIELDKVCARGQNSGIIY